MSALTGLQPVAPDLLRYEIANVGMSKVRRRECDLDAALKGLYRFAEIALDLMPVPLAPLMSLAARFSLSCYDASYLWLAGERCAPQCTLDRKPAEAARHHLQGGARCA